MAWYSYYDYLMNYYHDYYDYYYEYHYWPYYYGIYNVSNDSWCDYYHQNLTHYLNATTTTTSPLDYNGTGSTTTMAAYHNTEATHFYNTTFFVNGTFLNCTERYNGTFPPNPFPYEPWWYKEMSVIGPALVILAFVFAAMAVVICLYFVKQMKMALHKKGRQRPDKATVVLGTICMISHVVYCTMEIPAYWYWYFDYNEEIYFKVDMVWEVFWCLAKVSIYSLYAYRYYLISRASVVNSSTKNVQGLRFGLIGFCILMQIGLVIMFGFYYYDYATVSWEDPEFAKKQRMYLNAGWSIMGIDCLLVCFLGYLIIRSILRLVLLINDPAHQNMSKETTQSAASADSGGVASRSIQSATKTDNRLRIWSISLRSKSGLRSEERRKKRSTRQMNLIQVTTRIALTCMISLLSSLFVQFMWLIMEETENLGLLFFSYVWGFDAVVNMICIYLSMAFSKAHYKIVCEDCCKCHHCCLWCIMALVGYKVDKKEVKDIELETTQQSDVSPPSPVARLHSMSGTDADAAQATDVPSADDGAATNETK